MKQTGIIMTGQHPKLILDDLKTMTRRTYGLEKVNQSPSDWEFKRLNYGAIALFWRSNVMEEDIALCKCPYGQVGDRLWVRETWAAEYICDDLSPSRITKSHKIFYITDRKIRLYTSEIVQGFSPVWVGKTRPSIFMPRWASRITLEITELWAERLRGISPADAIAEGGYTVEEFIAMYLKLNKLPEDADPWNWAIRFRRL